MATIIVRHTVTDYSKWKPIFDSLEDARREAGYRSHTVLRDKENPSMISLLIKTDDLERTREFIRSGVLADATKRGGVQGQDVWICDELESVDYEKAERRPSQGEGAPTPMPH